MNESFATARNLRIRVVMTATLAVGLTMPISLPHAKMSDQERYEAVLLSSPQGQKIIEQGFNITVSEDPVELRDDLTGNGEDDVVISFGIDAGATGGNWWSVKIATIRYQGGIPHLASTENAPADVHTVTYEDGELVVQGKIHADSDPRCCPSEPIEKRYFLDDRLSLSKQEEPTPSRRGEAVPDYECYRNRLLVLMIQTGGAHLPTDEVIAAEIAIAYYCDGQTTDGPLVNEILESLRIQYGMTSSQLATIRFSAPVFYGIWSSAAPGLFERAAPDID